MCYSLANAHQKSGSKNASRLDKYKDNKNENEEMSKILTALRFFKDQANGSKNSSGHQKRSDKKENNTNIRNKENENDKGRDSVLSKEHESRPRTSRGKRGSKNRRKSGGESGGYSALGFHSNLPHQLLYNNIEHTKNIHNRSVNVGADSPREKKRKISKGRVSPNTFIVHHKHQNSGYQKASHIKNASLEAEKIALLNKTRPKSAKQKKKSVKTGDRSKKPSGHRHNSSVYSKGDVPSYAIIDNTLFAEDISYDKEEKALKKFMKKNNLRKAAAKIRINNDSIKANKHQGSKFMLVKRQDANFKNLQMPNEHMNYLEDLRKMHTNIEEVIQNKNNFKFEAKKKRMGSATKKNKKNKRSATPALSVPKGYLGN